MEETPLLLNQLIDCFEFLKLVRAENVTQVRLFTLIQEFLMKHGVGQGLLGENSLLKMPSGHVSKAP